MNTAPENFKYAKTHEWVVIDGDIVRVGITDFAQQELGDLVYVELPSIGRMVAAEEQCAVVESVKTASDLFSPVSGEIVAINESLADQPELINQDAYGTWLFGIKPSDMAELGNLMDADAYQKMIED